MGTWSEEFINLGQVAPAEVRAAGGLAGWIGQRLLAAVSTGGQRMVFYFPPRPPAGLDGG